ncbi:hypothetical protein AYO38_04980 [bacterium SCGC AG-212-C10]|nr:hypothetical protein AYO38_04980 [bacterium SCGC AG-212-C10]
MGGETNAARDVTVVDAHTHVFPPAQIAAREALAGEDRTFGELYANPAAKMAAADGLRAALERGGIASAVIAGFAFAGERAIAEQNEYLLGEAHDDAGRRLIPLATVNLALPGWERTATAALQDGARGFGELRPHNQGWDPLGRDARRLCAIAGEAGVPLLWHVSEPLGHAYPGKAGGIGAIELARLAGEFPATKMIAAHLGGGLAFFLHMPEIRVQLSLVYFDTAAWPLLYDDTSVSRLVEIAGAGRVLFGSDYPLLSPRRQLERLLPLLPPGSAEAVCGRNAENLFRG